jgi:simple sugar transport system substrate-binding protein
METKMKKRKIVVSLIIGVIIGIVGVSLELAKSVKAAEVTTKFTIYYIVHGGIAHPAWMANHKGVEDADALLPEVKVIYTGPETYDLEEFLTYIETAVAANPDALVCTMTAPEAMEPILMDAAKKGIVITEVNTGMAAPKTIPTLAYIGYRPYETGRAAAEKMMKMAKERNVTITRTVYANHHPGAVHIEEWGRGFVDVCKETGITSEQLDVTTDEFKGAEVLLAYVKANPDVDFIYHPSIAHCEAAQKMFEEEGITVPMGTFDFTPETMDLISEGKVWFTQDQQMYLQGFHGVMFTYLYLKYKFITPSIITTIGFVTPDNALEFKHYAEIGVR